MKTSIDLILKKTALILLFTSSPILGAVAQKTPKNYVGASGIIGLSRLSVGAGLEYERWFYTKNQFALGGKAHYIFPSKTFYGIFSTGDPFERNSQMQIMASSYLFMNAEKETKGFFLSFGAGINFIKWDVEAYDATGNSYIRSLTEASPGFDFSIGGQFNSKRIATRVAGGYQFFTGDKYDLSTSGKGTSLTYLKVSLGF